MRRPGVRHVHVALLVASTLLSISVLRADEVRVMTSGGFAAAHLELVSPFERATTHTVVTQAISMGVGENAIQRRLRRGEPTDIVIVADAAMEGLIKEGRIVADSRVALARSGIGMAVRAGAPKPDISSVAALRQTLLQATSIAYSAQISGAYLSMELFPRLGIADQVKGKSRRIEHERVGAVVARGEAELGFQQISELLPIAGIDYVGPLPAEVQRVTVFSAGIVVGAEHPEAARALMRFYLSTEGARAMVKYGLEPIEAR